MTHFIKEQIIQEQEVKIDHESVVSKEYLNVDSDEDEKRRLETGNNDRVFADSKEQAEMALVNAKAIR